MRGLLTSMESIDFQSDAFFKELVMAFEGLKKIKKDEITDHEIVGNLSAIVKHRTGLKVSFNIGSLDPSVTIPSVNKNNILINSFIRNYISSSDGIRMLSNADGVARGSVNIKTGVVSGIFSDVESTVNLPITMFTGSQFTPEEIAAVTLHEIGHLFTYYEFMSRTVTTNQALAGMSKALDNSAGAKEREAVLVSVKKALKLKDLDVEKLAATSNNKVIEVVVITNVAKECASEIGSNVYDFSSWEYLADQYAARQGAGRHLVTALDKIYRGIWNISFRSTIGYVAMEAFKAAALFVVPALGVMLMLIDSAGDGTYDVPGARLKRVRNQIVENLKDKKLSKDDQERLAADLAAIDDILTNVNDRRQLIGIIWDTLSPSSRKARNQELLQKELEEIAANDMFVKAAELKQLV